MPRAPASDRRELINFCFHLEQAHRAGLPILEALQDLRDSTDHDDFRNVLASISLAVEGGKGLSDAMADFPATFDRVFVALVRPASGPASCPRSWPHDRDAEVAGRAHLPDQEAVLYPAFVGTVVAGVVFFLMLYVVPQMSEFLKTMGQEMPMHTRALIATSEFVVALLVPAAHRTGRVRLLAGYGWCRMTRAAGEPSTSFKLRAWLVGPILQKIIMSRFATFFQIMYASGIPIVDALKTSRELAGNMVIAEALDRVSGYRG